MSLVSTSSKPVDPNVEYMIKPVISAAVYYGLNTIVMKKTTTTKSAITSAVCVATGTLIGMLISKNIPASLEASIPLLANGKGVIARLTESASALGVTVIADKYLLRNDYNQQSYLNMQTVGMFIGADLISELATDFVLQRKLDVLN